MCAHAYTRRNCTWDADSFTCLLQEQLWTTGWEGMEPEQLTWTDQRDIPYHVMSRSAIKLGRTLPRLLLLGDWLSIVWLVVNESFCITCFVLLIFFSFTYETVFTSHRVFLTSAPPILSPVLLVWSEWATVWCLTHKRHGWLTHYGKLWEISAQME